MTTGQTADPINRPSKAAFEFVQALAQELSGGRIELPSFPDVAIRVQRALADEDVRPDAIVRIIGAEPALAAWVLRMSNSAALNVTGRQITDLRTAVTRLGFNLVRSSAVSFAMSQLTRAEELKGLEQPLRELWDRSTLVAAMANVVAKQFTQVNSDTALLAGLLHGIGRLYLLTRVRKFPALFTDTASYNQIVSDWHANVAKAILENWDLADEIVAAVHEHEQVDRAHDGPADLTDVLLIGDLLASFREWPDSLELNLQGVQAVERMRLDRARLERVIEESANEVAAMRQALGQ
ncbi:MAG: HDOD domain-containing protein [Steroidobacteraceae bacterium]|nr:HDOD domain-containing protein [Steroidobacteraceae bacterium]